MIGVLFHECVSATDGGKDGERNIFFFSKFQPRTEGRTGLKILVSSQRTLRLRSGVLAVFQALTEGRPMHQTLSKPT